MRFLAGSAGFCLAATLVGAGATVAADGPLSAVWKEHRVEFVYMGRTSSYSCDGLTDKLRAIMTQLGARRDMRIVGIGCPEYGRPAGPNSLGPSLSIRFYSPALPTAADKVRGRSDRDAVDAHYEPFKIVPDAFRDMSVGDCELVEEFAQQVLPKFTVRGLKKAITCIPYQLSGSDYSLRGEALRAQPTDIGRAASTSSRSAVKRPPQTQPVSRPTTSALRKKPSVDQ